MSLLERDSEIGALAGAVERTREGSGELLVVEGPAGIGKTSLLERLRRLAHDADIDVLAARGGELERDFSFGVVRQLFEPRLRDSSEREREALMSGAAKLAAPIVIEAAPPLGDVELPERAHASLHGLYWLTVSVASVRPVLLCVDDAHWADRPSLRFLAYLAPRLEGIALLVAVGLRAAEPEAETELLDVLTGDPAARVLSPPPLSADAASSMIAEQVDAEPDADFATACHAATGGNPFLLRALADTLAADGVDPIRERAGLVGELGSRPVARGLLRRLRQFGDQAEELAAAVAVLGEGARVGEAAALASLAPAGASEVAENLAEAQILWVDADRDRVGFVHPVIRTAVYRGTPATARAEAHRRAARLLAAGMADQDRVAQHLLRADRREDAWVVEALREAAERAMERGAPDVAAVFLERALAEPPAGAQRPGLLLAHGIARARDDLSGEPSMRSALELSSQPIERARIALALGRAVGLRGEHDRAVGILDQARAELGDGDRDLGLRLNAEMIAHCLHAAGRLELGFEVLSSLPADVTGESAAERLLLTVRTFAATAAGHVDAGTASALIRPTTGDAALIEEENSSLLLFTAETLVFADALDDAAALLDRALVESRARGSQPGVALASAFRAQVNLRRGRVLEAEADGRTALDLVAPEALGYSRPYAVSFLIDALVERGELDAAEELAAELGPSAGWPQLWQFGILAASVGALRVAQGRPREGLALLLECGLRLAPWRPRNPSSVPWRSAAALVHHALGEADEAGRLAEWELGHARAGGGTRGLGVALRAAGVVREGEQGLELLRESIDVLEGSGARLEHGRALVDLGTALHRLGRRAQAREPLRLGLDIAVRCGATSLATRARSELAAAGALPRRELLSGPESLTPRELQVAKLAATGATSREIAQALFVTEKTVEAHLGRAYAKLEIGSRRELADALGTAG